ncbi:hypothetical protein [Rhizobium phaseoli]|uniref:hypothetical protein n=1 Tax=Rhizobium phaseoli TaxID=396 RepID=UPI0007EB3D1F|nr:hypothetical protein [Rhizobium phaseoli]
MSSSFDPKEALSRFGESASRVVLHRLGSEAETYKFQSMHDALLFAKSDASNPVKIELHVRAHGHNVVFDGDNLNALLARGGDKNDPGGYGGGGTGDGGG